MSWFGWLVFMYAEREAAPLERQGGAARTSLAAARLQREPGCRIRKTRAGTPKKYPMGFTIAWL